MTKYYSIKDGAIYQWTESEAVARALNLTEQTNKEIVYGYDGKFYFAGEEPVPPEPSYIEKRLTEYPSVQDQLDMIYWDKVNNTNVWQETITAIKTKYPKK